MYLLPRTTEMFGNISPSDISTNQPTRIILVMIQTFTFSILKQCACVCLCYPFYPGGENLMEGTLSSPFHRQGNKLGWVKKFVGAKLRPKGMCSMV